MLTSATHTDLTAHCKTFLPGFLLQLKPDTKGIFVSLKLFLSTRTPNVTAFLINRLFLFVVTFLHENVPIVSPPHLHYNSLPIILYICCYSDFTPKNRLPWVAQVGAAHTETDHKVGLGTEKVSTRSQPHATRSTLLGERHCAPRSQLRWLGT